MRLKYILGIPIVMMFIYLAFNTESDLARSLNSCIAVFLIFIWFIPERIRDKLWKVLDLIEEKW